MKKFLNFTNPTVFNEIWAPRFNQDYYASILCSVSGGQDSIGTFFSLLHMFSFENKNSIKSISRNQLQKKKIKMIYCQHFWQIKNFFLCFFLFQMCFNLNYPYIVILPSKIFLNENYSRNWRKKSFYRISQLEKNFLLSLGHTKTDLIEKNFHNIFRGTTRNGINNSIGLYQRNCCSSFFFVCAFEIVFKI